MDIRVGAPPPVGPPAGKAGESGTRIVEAKVLAVRRPRRRSGSPPDATERRRSKAGKDPAGGRVLVLLITDGASVPAGVESGEYRVFVRFARR